MPLSFREFNYAATGFPRTPLLGSSCITPWPTIIFPVLSFFLAVLALSLPLRLPWLDPRLPWLALRLPWPVVLCALRRARLVYGKAPQAHQRDLRAHDGLVVLHRKKVVSVPRWSPPPGPAAPLRTSGRS